MDDSGIPSLLSIMAVAGVIIGITVGMAAITWAFMFS